MNDNFDMDIGEGFADNFDNSSFEDNIGGGFSDSDQLEYTEETEKDENTNGLKKQTIFVVIAGIVIVIAALGIWRIGKAKTSDNSITGYTGVEDSINKKDNNGQNSNTVNNVSNSNWTEIDGQQDIGNVSEVEATFTVTSIKHVARSNSNEMEVMTRLQGSMSGFTGTYEVDVPYSKGVKLNIGDTFKVSVNTGRYGDKTVVDGIDY